MAEIHLNRPDHQGAFIALNEAWIERFFAIEEVDRRLARNPGRILDEGGAIWTATEGARVVGACALFRQDEWSFELARMAVDPAHQGRGIGRTLAEAAIRWAGANGAIRITLLTNTVLAPAVALYESLGFEVTRRGPHPDYARCNLVMALELAAPG
ncbi:GNAT family N-acetyltransferase [Myxococcota bacterium]|nr:GNAT family N-acetyltransferase [Myxococcota bacterium]